MAITKVERMREWLKNPDNYQRWLEGQRKRKQLLKENILTHYGNGKCACVAGGENRLGC